jgi:fatty-acyl-CoA synthase
MTEGRAGAPAPVAHLPALLDALAEAQPGAPALIERERSFSFAELRSRSVALAAGLRGLGIARGDRVGIWLPNVSAWLEMFFACARLGAVAVAINTRFRAAELGDILRRSGCRALCFWPGFERIDFLSPFQEIVRDLPELRHVIVYDEGAAPAVPGRAVVHAYRDLLDRDPTGLEPPANAPCVIFTTSGTTKAPKFVLHDQATLLRHASDAARALGYEESGAVVLLPIPFCGTFGLATALAALHAGRPVVTTPTFDAPAQARLIRERKVTHFNAPSAAVEQLLEAGAALGGEGPPFPSLREVGFANFSPNLDRLLARAEAAGVTLVGLYGSSEMQALLARQPGDAPLETRSLAGGVLVAAEARVRAVDPQSRAVLPEGEAGELEFLAPSRTLEYFGDPDATRAALTPDGYFRSGDLGYTTGPNSFVFLARIGDSLRLGGYLVNPAEIEAVIEEVDGIAAAQVVAVGIDGAHRPVAFAIPEAGRALDPPAVIAHCQGRLARFKAPVRVFPIEAFPTAAGPNGAKIQKNKLVERAEALIAEEASAAIV